MKGFQIEASTLTSPAFVGLSPGARGLLLAMHALGLSSAGAEAIAGIGGTTRQTAELAKAGLISSPSDGVWELAKTQQARKREATRNRVRRFRERRKGVTESVTPSVTETALPSVTDSPESVTPSYEPPAENGTNPVKTAISPALPSVTPLACARAHGSLSLISSSSLLALSGSEISDAGARVAAPVPKPKREPKPKALTWRVVPADWQPSPEHRQIARDLRVDFDLELAKFRDFEFGRPRRDPNATFRNWLRNAKPAQRGQQAPTRPASEEYPMLRTKADVDRFMAFKPRLAGAIAQ